MMTTTPQTVPIARAAVASRAGIVPERGRRIPELDGVRGVAILLVLYWHYVVNQLLASSAPLARWLTAAGAVAWSGVDLFFVLSGFLIGGILLDNRSSPNLLAAFYARRACRIFPLYFAWLALFVVVAANWHGAPRALVGKPLPLWSYASYLQNVMIARQGRFGPNWLGITWSLAIEEQFYLLLPAMVLMLRPRLLVAVLTVLIASAPAARFYWLGASPAGSFAAAVLLPCRWDALFLGVVGAWLVRRDGFTTAVRARPWTLYAAVLLGLAVAVVLGALGMRPAGGRYTLGFTALAIFYLAVVLAAVLSPERGVLRRTLRLGPLRGLGMIAYGVYLIHQSVVAVVHYLARGAALPSITSASTAALTALSLVLSLAIAALSYRFFESPLIRLGHRVGYAPPRGTTAPIVAPQ